MCRLGRKIFVLWIGVLLVAPSLAARGQDPERTPHDYFLQPPHSELLVWAQKYHLNSKKFFAQLKAGHYEYALGEVLIVLDYLPNHPKALALLHVVAPLAGKPSIVVHRYERALQLYPQHALTHAQFGMYLTNLGQVKKGIAHLKMAIDLDPQKGTFYAWLAKAYEKIGKTKLAQQAVQQARALGYRDPDVH